MKQRSKWFTTQSFGVSEGRRLVKINQINIVTICNRNEYNLTCICELWVFLFKLQIFNKSVKMYKNILQRFSVIVYNIHVQYIYNCVVFVKRRCIYVQMSINSTICLYFTISFLKMCKTLKLMIKEVLFNYFVSTVQDEFIILQQFHFRKHKIPLICEEHKRVMFYLMPRVA